jgi:hypothetical protein
MALTRKQKTLGCVALAMLSLGLVLYVLWTQLFIHDWYLWHFSRSFSRVAHPAASRHIKSYRKLGLLIAHGNHIDLFSGELRSYTGSQQQVVDWYASQRVPSQLAPGERVPVQAVFIAHGKLSSGEIGFDRPYTLSGILRDAERLAPSAANLYIVYVLDATGFDPGIDIRGM